MLAGLDVLQQLSLTFDKSTLPAGDKRPPWHPCLFITSSLEGVGMWDSCAAVGTKSIGPCPLIRVSDMLGYDAENRPAPSARLEQSFGTCVVCLVFVFRFANIQFHIAYVCAENVSLFFLATCFVSLCQSMFNKKGKESQHTR